MSKPRPLILSEEKFTHELNVMISTVRRGLKAFYVSLCLDELWMDDMLVRQVISKNQELWVTFRSGLQADYILVLHRLLDDHPKTRHSLTKFIRTAYAHPEFFSKTALEQRKMIGDYRPEYLTRYIAHAWDFDCEVFADLGCQLARYRGLYERDYRALRNQVFAHIGTIDEREFAQLVAKTDVGALEEMFCFVWDLVRQLEDLLNNGNKPMPGRFARPDKQKFKESVRSTLIPDDVFRDRLPL
jgi:hypothetical protein